MAHSHDFEPMMRKYLRQVKPRRILEWGPGRSTAIMREECPDAEIHSIEHQRWYYDRAKARAVANLHLVPIKQGPSWYDAWPLQFDRVYDFIFVDGRRRAACLLHARDRLSKGGVVMLHDAERPQYAAAMRLYDLVEHDGRTAVLSVPKFVNDVSGEVTQQVTDFP